MIWQIYDNQEVAILEEKMAEELNSYLQKKEAILSFRIAEAIHLDRNVSSALEGGVAKPERLNEAIEELGKKAHLLAQMKQPKAISPHWKVTTKQINEALWNYVEVLEGSAVELFQQIELIGFEHWDLNLSRSVTAVKDELTHRLNDLLWGIRRLEQQLKTYRSGVFAHQNKWNFFDLGCFFCRRLLDPNLEIFVAKCQKFLNFRYGRFIDRYLGCVQLYEKQQKTLSEFRGSRFISLKDIDLRDRFGVFYQFLNLWELNKSSRTLPERETVRAVRRLTTQTNALALFEVCLKAIKTSIFDQSRGIKKEGALEGEENQILGHSIDNMSIIKSEVRLVTDAIVKYRHFTIDTDPSLTRWWIFGGRKESSFRPIKHLNELINESNRLDKVASEFQISLESNKMMERRLTPELLIEVSNHLHEMGQPLASKDLMKRHAKALLNRLNGLDEMGASNGEVVNYVCHTLSRAMLVDWKYHVLQEYPLFHQLYNIHQDIQVSGEDRLHLNRLNKFRQLVAQLEQWIVTRNTISHLQDIEVDINDIKSYLQDFFAQIQRLELSRSSVSQSKDGFHKERWNAREALLEYQYLFGSFFHKLHHNEPEQWLLRKQLLFVDQYFEAIDSKLADLDSTAGQAL